MLTRVHAESLPLSEYVPWSVTAKARPADDAVAALTPASALTLREARPSVREAHVEPPSLEQ